MPKQRRSENVPKIICPKHDDTNASMELYDNGIGHCFVCGAHMQILDAVNSLPRKPKVIEDVASSIRDIRALPMKHIRGLWLHCDAGGYYIVWPENNFYKYRLTSGYPRYVGPTGHTPPLFWAKRGVANSTLIIVEGELNALSIAEASSDWDVVSPGSASNFGSKEAELLELAGKYQHIIVWTDHDSAGIMALWKLLPVLVNRPIKCSHISQEMDANEVLCVGGYPAVGGTILHALRGSK